MVSFNRKFTLADALWIPLKITPLYGGIYLLISLINAVIPAIQVLAVANFIDTVTQLGGGASKTALLSPALWLLAMMVVQMLLGPVEIFIRARFTMKLRRQLRLAYVDKMSRLQYQHIESPETWDIINRITFEFNTWPVYMEERFGPLFQDMISLLRVIGNIVSMVVVLSCQIWWIGLVMLAISVPMMFLSYKLGGKNYSMHQKYRRFMRVSCNFGEMLLFRQYVLERFLFQFAPRLNEKWGQNYRFIQKNTVMLNVKSTSIMKLGGLLSTVLSLAVILCMAYFVSIGQVSMGIFLAMVTALFSLSQVLSWEMSYYLYAVARGRGFLKDLSSFSQLEEISAKEMQEDVDPGPFERLEFRNVRFRYPGTQQYVLDGVSLVMEKGKHYAFVGVNGAGKTTITKLITGLYTDYEGEILLNGIELRKIPTYRLLQYYAVVFQDFAKYAIPLNENIRLGNPNATSEQIRQAIGLVGLEKAVEALPQKGDTPLGKIKEDGVELSGGEWQRVAMARAVVSQAAVKILDEPTAALDPISESQVYQQFGEISRDATTVFISHRLGSTKLADVIYVLEKGKITEQGDHETLMNHRSAYCNMFESQRSWYL